MSTFTREHARPRAVTDDQTNTTHGSRESLHPVDQRTAAVTQRELQQSMDQSAKVESELQLSELLNQSPRVAAQMKLAEVMAGRMGALQAQRAIQRQDALEEEEPLQAMSEPLQKQENRTGLPDALKAGVESLSGLPMDDVRVYYNSGAPQQLKALAYTQGTEIHVAPGQEQHLAHEAWHVAQQKQGRVKATRQMKGMAINDDASLEREAEVQGEKALSAGLKPSVQRRAGLRRSAETAVAGGTVQAFTVPIGFKFKSGHTSQPTSMELQKIGGSKKKHHIIPDSVLLVYLESMNRSHSLGELDGWATSALEGEIERLRELDVKIKLYGMLDEALDALKGRGMSLEAFLRTLNEFLEKYPGTQDLAGLSLLRKAAQLITGYLEKMGAYPVDTSRKLKDWEEKGTFQEFFNIRDIEELAYGNKLATVAHAVGLRLEAILAQFNREELEIFSTEANKAKRLEGSITERQDVINKIKSQDELSSVDINNILVPALTWLPANIMIGPEDRKWEPGDELDVEVLAKHPDNVSAAIITRLATLLKDHKGAPLLDEQGPGLTSMSSRILTEIAGEYGSNVPKLLEQITRRKPAKSVTLEAGPKEADQSAWEGKKNEAVSHASKGLDYDEHRHDDLYSEAFGMMSMLKSLLGWD